MTKLNGIALTAAILTLAACGNPAETRDDAQEAGITGDTSPTLQGQGDLTSAAGAGADTAAMDGGKAGDDGTPAADQGEGGPADALSGRR